MYCTNVTNREYLLSLTKKLSQRNWDYLQSYGSWYTSIGIDLSKIRQSVSLSKREKSITVVIRDHFNFYLPWRRASRIFHLRGQYRAYNPLNIGDLREDEGWEQFLFFFFYPFISISCFCCLLQTRFKLGCFVSSEQNDKNVLLVILKKMLCFSPFFLKIKWTQKVLLMIENKCLM